MVITKREVMVSVIIAFLLLSLGLFIDSKIVEHTTNEQEKYNKALKIDNDETMFKYAMETSIGDVIVYGNFNVDKGVSSDWLTKDYMYVQKVTERYTRHTRTSCSGSGKTRSCRTETYHTWDTIDRDENSVNNVNFSGVSFSYDKFEHYPTYTLTLTKDNVVDSKVSYIKSDTYIYEKNRFFGADVGDKRYYYKVVSKSFNGTIFAKAKNGNLDDNNISINYCNINDYLESNKTGFSVGRFLFWFIYVCLSAVLIYVYLYYDNDYLED